MTQTIDRMYPSAEVANEAVKKLTSLGFRIHDMHLVTPAAADQGDTEDTKLEAVMAAIMKGMVPKAKARIFAVGVYRGGSLVTVHAPFGYAQLAIDTLDSFGPIDSGYVEPVEPAPVWNEATPLSSALQMPLLSNDPTPFETFFGVPTLARTGMMLSRWFGLPMLSDNAAPFSSMLGLTTRLADATPLSSRLGLRVLSSNPTPFSSMFNLPLLKATR